MCQDCKRSAKSLCPKTFLISSAAANTVLQTTDSVDSVHDRGSKHLVSSSMGPPQSLAMVLSSPQHSLDYIAQWLLGVLLI